VSSGSGICETQQMGVDMTDMTNMVRPNESPSLDSNVGATNISKSSVMWEFKWKNEEEVNGPLSTSTMQKYVDRGKFESINKVH